MSSLLEEVFDYLNMSDEDRFDKAFNASKALVGYLEPMFDGDDAYEAYVQIIAIICSVDGIYQHLEYDFFKKLTEVDITYDQFTEWMDAEYEKVDLDEFFEFAANQEDEFKQALLELVLCVITCDYSLHRNELKFIDEYF